MYGKPLKSRKAATSTSYFIVDWFPLLWLASSASGGVGNLIYEWMFS
jgi:hypothetical protein